MPVSQSQRLGQMESGVAEHTPYFAALYDPWRSGPYKYKLTAMGEMGGMHRNQVNAGEMSTDYRTTFAERNQAMHAA